MTTEQNESQRLIALIGKLSEKLPGRHMKVMEVCGTHTVTAQRSGLHSILPENLRLVSGPGCPVCVTPAGYIEQAVELTLSRGAHIVTYGDMLRVPGLTMSLEDARRQGGKITVAYSVHAALKLARENPQEKVVFLGIGFETTTPPSAYAVKVAHEEALTNFMVFSAHKIMIPAMEALLADPNLAIDGYLAPGHVSVIIGTDAYKAMTERYRRPCVVAGFEANQMLLGLVRILSQIISGSPAVESVYADRVKAQGNIAAQGLIDEIFTTADSRWRGVGVIPGSGLVLREAFSKYDAKQVFDLPDPQEKEPAGCLCANVIKGIDLPTDCPLFGKACTPNNPVGACMVSREGTCSAYFKYRKA
ncbi:MAG: hydrogenase formation protein HypD [Phycisphaerae bacterium]|nr:hydrogenase formation protein HypD [Phycisphaerae bacterium]